MREASVAGEPRSWQEIAAQTQAYRESTLASVSPAIPETPPEKDLPVNVMQIPQQLLSARELEITECSLGSLLRYLRHGQWSSTEVTTAFLRRAGLAQRLTNCVTELLVDRALNRARVLDKHMEQYKTPIGPLHGLPISVKEHISMKHLDLNAAWCGWVGQNKIERDAEILRILEDAGAVFHARTTEPQTTMHLETSSNLYGVTVNPFNRNLTAGGSSGGEGALIALGGSHLGIGSDIGGSIRSPAANCALYGLRPTTYRMPLLGTSETMIGMEQVVGVLGPLSSSLEGINLFMRAILDSRPWLVDPALAPIPWRSKSEIFGSDDNVRLKIGILWDDGVVKPHPPVLRALRETVAKLSCCAGIECVEWVPYKHDFCWQIIASLYFPDGGQEEKDAIALTNEPWRPLSKWIVLDNPYVKHLDIAEVWSWTRTREEYRAEYAAHWNGTATGQDSEGKPTGVVDLILSPVGPGAAPPLDCARYWGYTSQWNLLDYPAAVFPVTSVNADLDPKDNTYKPRNAQDRYNHDLYDPAVYKDAPVSLQLIGRRFDDEKVMYGLEMIQKHLSA